MLFVILYNIYNVLKHPFLFIMIIFFLVRSLQAQVAARSQKKKRASCFASCEGSATVETILVFPVFLCVICGLMMMGHLVLTEGKIQYAVSKTADTYAKKTAVSEWSKEGGDVRADVEEVNQDGDSIGQNIVDTISVQTIFSSVYETSSVDKNCIRGGRSGIIVTVSEEGDNLVEVRAVYCLKVEIPFIGSYSFPKTTTVVQRIFSGYTSHGAEGGDADDNSLVYVAENGTVYHTSLSCSHICLRISGENVEKILEGHKYHACDKCIEEGEVPSSIYVTVYGEKYHSSLNCSGLKRTVKTVRKDEVGNMKMCSRCAAAAGK